MLKVSLGLLFYLIMGYLYLFADGKIGKSKKNKKWAQEHGVIVKKSVIKLVLIYTIVLIISNI